MPQTEQNQPERQIETVSDAEWAQMQRDAMGDDYPGDAEMQRQRDEFQADFEARTSEQAQAAPAEAPAAARDAAATAPAEAKEWNARDWLNETFKDDPGFKDLSEADMARLETLANEKRDEFAADVQDWAQEKSGEWSTGLRDSIKDGLDASGRLEGFYESHLADGDFSDADKAALKDAAEGMTAAEGAALGRPIIAEMHEINGDFIDGVEMIADHAIDDIHEIVEARAEMPGGDGEQVQKMLHDLEEAPDKIHDALDWEREQADREFGKVEDRLELIEAGTDPNDLPPDTDTYQIDDNADHYETAEA